MIKHPSGSKMSYVHSYADAFNVAFVDITAQKYNNMTDNEKTNVELFVSTWQQLSDRKTGPGDSFDDVINRLLENSENSQNEYVDEAVNADDKQQSVDKLEPVEEIVKELNPQSYGSPDQEKREIVSAALELLRDQGHAYRKVIQDEQGERLPASDVVSATYWQEYVRPAYQLAVELDYAVYKEASHPKKYVWVGE